MEAYCEQILRIVVAQISQSIGWDSIMTTPLEQLIHIFRKYIQDLGARSLRNAELCCRSEVNIMDVNRAFCDLNIDLSGLLGYMSDFGSLPCAVHVPNVPVKLPSRCAINRGNGVKNERLLAINQEKENVAVMNVEDTSVPISVPIFSSSKLRRKRGLPLSQRELPSAKHRDIAAAEVLMSLQNSRECRREENHSHAELKSVWMSPSGLIVPSTEGKLPDSKIPADLERDPIRIRITKQRFNHYFISFTGSPEAFGIEAEKRHLPKIDEETSKNSKLLNSTLNGCAGNLEDRSIKYIETQSQCITNVGNLEGEANCRDITLNQYISDPLQHHSQRKRERILTQKCAFMADSQILSVIAEPNKHALVTPDFTVTSQTIDYPNLLKKPEESMHCAELRAMQTGMPFGGVPVKLCECCVKAEIKNDQSNDGSVIIKKIMSGESVVIGSTSVHLVEHGPSVVETQCTNSLWNPPCCRNRSLVAHNKASSLIDPPVTNLPRTETQSISIFPIGEPQSEVNRLLPMPSESNIAKDTTIHSVSLIPIQKVPTVGNGNSINIISQEILQSNVANCTIGGLNLACVSYANDTADTTFSSVDTTSRYNLRQRYLERPT